MDVFTSVLSDPKGWAAAFGVIIGTPLGIVIRWVSRLQKRVEACEVDRVRLHTEMNTARRDLDVERGRVNALTDLFKREANIG